MAQRIALSPEEYYYFKIRLAEHPNGDVREAYRLISIFEQKLVFLQQEFSTVMSDYILEVARCNELHKNLKKTIELLKNARRED